MIRHDRNRRFSDLETVDQADNLSPDTLALICKALGHTARLRIIDHLKNCSGCVCGEIVDILPLAQSTVSQHLKILKEAGLITGEVEGTTVCYCLDRKLLERFQRTVASL